jgi:Fe-S-cluster containining protein
MTVETWQPGMFERPCAGCTMCCKTPGIPEIGKPANVWCRHCDKGRGCRIYDARPQACRDFHCLWKVMPDFPEELRPDRCKVIWTMTEDGTTAVATTEYLQALAAKAQERLIRQFEAAGITAQVRDRSARD